MKNILLNEEVTLWLILILFILVSIGSIWLRYKQAQKEFELKQKNQWNKVLETKNFIVEYSAKNNKYKVSYFDNNRFVDECLFTPYNYSCPEGCPGTLGKYDL